MLATTMITAFNGQGTGKSGDLSRVTQPTADKRVYPPPDNSPRTHAQPSAVLGKGGLSRL